MPGVEAQPSKSGNEANIITLKKIDLGFTRIFCKVIDSEDIFTSTVTFEFYFTDQKLIDTNGTIELQL